MKKSKISDDSKLFAFLGVLLTVIGYIVVMLSERKKDPYAVFYAKQGLVLGIAWIIASVVATVILARIPFFGWIIGSTLHLVMLVLWIIGIVYSFSGEQKEIPVIGEYASKF